MIGLINVLAGKILIPEFVQKELKPERIAAELISMLDTGRRRQLQEQMRAVTSGLGTTGVAVRVAENIRELCKE